MRPTSSRQYETARAGGFPELEQVREELWSAALPTGFPAPHVPYTLAHLIRDAHGDVHLIDTSADTDDAWQALTAALAAIGSSLERVASVTITHLHLDHLGMAQRVRAASGAPVILSRADQESLDAAAVPADRAEEWGVPQHRRAELVPGPQPLAGFRADRVLDDGMLLEIPGRQVVVVHTPGHTAGHLAFSLPGEGVLLSGDHLLPDIFPGIGLDGRDDRNPIGDYLGSLDRMLEFSDCEVLPAHGYRFEGLAARVAETAAHHRRRTEEVSATLAAHPELGVWELASRLSWTLGWEQLRGGNLHSALRQTHWHAELSRSGAG